MKKARGDGGIDSLFTIYIYPQKNIKTTQLPLQTI